MLSETLVEALDQAGKGIDGKGGGFEIRRLSGQVYRPEFEQAHGVIRDDHVGWGFGEALAGFGECFEGI